MGFDFSELQDALRRRDIAIKIAPHYTDGIRWTGVGIIVDGNVESTIGVYRTLDETLDAIDAASKKPPGYDPGTFRHG